MDKPSSITPVAPPPRRMGCLAKTAIILSIAWGLLVASVYAYWIGGTFLGHRSMAVSMAHLSDYRFDLSPDGKTIVFAGGDRDHPDLYLLDLPSGKVRTLFHSREYKQSPLFSHDGSKVLYSAGKDAAGGFNLFEIPLSGGQPKKLTNDGGVRDIADFVTDDGTVILNRFKTLGWIVKMGPWAIGQQLVMRPNAPPERDGRSPMHEFGGAGRARELSLRPTPLPTKVAPGPAAVRWRWAELKVDYSKAPPVHAVVLVSQDGKNSHESALPKGLPQGRISRVRVSPDGRTLYALVLADQTDTLDEPPYPELWLIDLQAKKCNQYAGAKLFWEPLNWKPGE